MTIMNSSHIHWQQISVDQVCSDLMSYHIIIGSVLIFVGFRFLWVSLSIKSTNIQIFYKHFQLNVWRNKTLVITKV